MRYPTTRYGYHQELEFWMQGRSVAEIAKRLKRSERSVHDWLHGKRKVPWWVPEILRLQHYEYQDRLRQMGFTPTKTRLAVAKADILAFPKTAPQPTSASAPQPQNQPESHKSSIR